tara:strand:- start:4790 stop:5833 length:1044 start_codon:yes stop_codon:yes gene_type:complete
MVLGKLILKWYDINKRDLPWRQTKNPYNIWISEIILQQTRMEQGIYYYNRFISKFPNLKTLANSDEKDVLLLWQGLGYYSRARNLHYTSKYLFNQLNSEFPETYDELIKLKGIGDYTASAISSICFEKAQPVLDGNVFRIISRVYEINNPIDLNSSRKVFKEKAKEMMPNERFGDYNQSLMDFGSIICKPIKPLCSSCVISKICSAFKNNSVEYFPVKNSKSKIKSLYFDYIVVKNNNYVLLEQIKKGIWKNLYQFPVYISESQKDKKEILKFLAEKYQTKNLKINLIDSEFIQHKLSHINVRSRFWLTENTINVDEGIYVSSFEEYPMSKLMHKFIEKYTHELSLS